MPKREKVLLVFDSAGTKEIDHDYREELKTEDWQTESDVIDALKRLGHECELVGLHDDLEPLRRKLAESQPDIIFNMVEAFANVSAAEQKITSYLELQGVPFTGCGSVGITLCKNKGVSKKILGYHRIRVPEFAVFPVGRAIKRPARLDFPILVKPLEEEASYGISSQSLVDNEEDFNARVQFVHDKFRQAAIAEEYIDGRELYVGIIGNQRLKVFPPTEMVFKQMPEDGPRFATFKAKWDWDYRERWGIENDFARLEPDVARAVEKLCRRIYHLLLIDGYARLDFRLTPANEIVFIEANPNPALAAHEDFALAAGKAGLDYPRLIDRILKLARSTMRH